MTELLKLTAKDDLYRFERPLPWLDDAMLYRIA